MRAVPINACVFNTSNKFLLCKDVRPRKGSLFHCPSSRVSLVSTALSVGGKFEFLQITAWFFKRFRSGEPPVLIYPNLERTVRFQRRIGGYLTHSNCFCGTWVITRSSAPSSLASALSLLRPRSKTLNQNPLRVLLKMSSRRQQIVMVSQLVGKRSPLKTGWAVLPVQVTFQARDCLQLLQLQRSEKLHHFCVSSRPLKKARIFFCTLQTLRGFQMLNQQGSQVL